MKEIKPIPYGRQCIGEDDIAEVSKALKQDFLTCGPKVKEFEEIFAKYVGAKYAVAVSNGTAALHLACLASGLQPNEELITSPMTFAASANCAFYCGAKPIFVDINDQGMIDENKIEEKITENTRIIIPVHYTGLPCKMKKINEIARKYDLIVIEDACHALGARYEDSKIGDCKYSDMACFSFHPVKHITTGEGGMITTNSKELYEKILRLRHHGITKDPNQLNSKNEGPWYHEMQDLGFNYRITDFQCALGISQLGKIDKFVQQRRDIANKYKEQLKFVKNIILPSEKTDQFNSYHLFVVQLKDKETRLNVFNYLKDKGVCCQVHYIPVYLHPYYQNKGYPKMLCPKAEEFYSKIISLPLFPELSKEEQDTVVKVIKEVL